MVLFTIEECKVWLTNKLINPVTKRNISEGKSVYKTLLKACQHYGLNTLTPTPPTTTSPSISLVSSASSTISTTKGFKRDPGVFVENLRDLHIVKGQHVHKLDACFKESELTAEAVMLLNTVLVSFAKRTVSRAIYTTPSLQLSEYSIKLSYKVDTASGWCEEADSDSDKMIVPYNKMYIKSTNVYTAVKPLLDAHNRTITKKALIRLARYLELIAFEAFFFATCYDQKVIDEKGIRKSLDSHSILFKDIEKFEHMFDMDLDRTSAMFD